MQLGIADKPEDWHKVGAMQHLSNVVSCMLIGTANAIASNGRLWRASWARR